MNGEEASAPANGSPPGPPKMGPAVSMHPYDQLQTLWPAAARDFAGQSRPIRIEGDIRDLQVLGAIPKQINGTFYRVLPDPGQPQTVNTKDGEMFVPIDGDGSIGAFRIKDGHVDWKQRYVQTERYKLEKKARKPLFGVYRNPYTYHPCVKAALDSTANTNIIIHAGKLLALKESGQAYELNPNTLETIKYNPYNMDSLTFTAHPKLDMLTGELVGFGYEAKGLATKDICYFVLDAAGKVTKELWFEWPHVGFMHDCVLTPNYLILYSWSYFADLEQMKKGGHHWTYDEDLPITWAVVPRNLQDTSEIKFFKFAAGQPGHIASGWEDDQGRIHFDSSFVRGQDFGFFPTKGGKKQGRPGSYYVRWTIDPEAASQSYIAEPEILIDMPCEFPRVDDRTVCKGTGEYRYSWVLVFMPHRTDGGMNQPLGLNGIAMRDNKTGETKIHYVGDDCFVQEPVFIPRSHEAEEGDGYILAMVDRVDLKCNDLVILDTKEYETGPVAVIRLPFSLKPGIHGNWIDVERIPGGNDDLDPVCL